MLDIFAPIDEACDLRVPEKHRIPIAVIGAGAIAEVAHLPAYRHFDSIRALLGTPETVFCAAGTRPGQVPRRRRPAR